MVLCFNSYKFLWMINSIASNFVMISIFQWIKLIRYSFQDNKFGIAITIQMMLIVHPVYDLNARSNQVKRFKLNFYSRFVY
jgi:hypothetical protein